MQNKKPRTALISFLIITSAVIHIPKTSLPEIIIIAISTACAAATVIITIIELLQNERTENRLTFFKELIKKGGLVYKVAEKGEHLLDDNNTKGLTARREEIQGKYVIFYEDLRKTKYLNEIDDVLSSPIQELGSDAKQQEEDIIQIIKSTDVIKEMIRQTLSNAENAKEKAKQLQEGITGGVHAFQDAFATMEGVSKEVENIKELARQTNMLALNASIEAARAGENGKGFSIVASEVQKLADKSSIASENIVHIAEKAKNTVFDAEKKLGKLIGAVVNNREIVGFIAEAGGEELKGTEMINNSISELKEIVIKIRKRTNAIENILEAVRNSGDIDQFKTNQKLISKSSSNKQDWDISMNFADACRGGYITLVDKMLENDKKRNEYINSVGANGCPALTNAIFAGYTDIAKKIVVYGADLEAACSHDGLSPLMAAVNEENAEMVRVLLEAGADPNAVSKNSSFPLILVSWRKCTEIAKLLIEFGADLNKKSNRGATPLIYASSAGQLEMMQIFLDNGAAVNIPAETGETPLIAAAKSGHAQAVRKLLKHGANPKHKTKEGKTALVYAEEREKTEVCKVLKEAQTASK